MSRSLLLLTLSVLGCTQAPDVRAVSPSEGPAGTEIRIEGETFDTEVSVTLRPDGADQGGTALSLTSVSASSLVGTVPEALQPGAYTLVVKQSNQTVLVPRGFTVRAPPQDQPCGQLYTANTQVSPLTGQVVIDRFYRDGKRETVRKTLDEVQRVAFERIAVEGGKRCSVIYLETDGGERLRFADVLEGSEPAGKGLDLKARAYKLGQEIGKPVEVTREDPAAPAASEQAGEAAGG